MSNLSVIIKDSYRLRQSVNHIFELLWVIVYPWIFLEMNTSVINPGNKESGTKTNPLKRTEVSQKANLYQFHKILVFFSLHILAICLHLVNFDGKRQTYHCVMEIRMKSGYHLTTQHFQVPPRSKPTHVNMARLQNIGTRSSKQRMLGIIHGNFSKIQGMRLENQGSGTFSL